MGRALHDLDLHEPTVGCLERHDPATAVKIMGEHLRGTEHVLAGLLPS